MQQLREIHETVFEKGAALLMARIVDSAGVCVRRDQVSSVRCSILELDPRRELRGTVVPGHDRVPLDLDDVFLDSLELGRLWDVDTVGYNFRHEIRANAGGSFPRPGALYEIRYLLTPMQGPATILRFRIRIVA